jgi:hypothetical protein
MERYARDAKRAGRELDRVKPGASTNAKGLKRNRRRDYPGRAGNYARPRQTSRPARRDDGERRQPEGASTMGGARSRAQQWTPAEMRAVRVKLGRAPDLGTGKGPSAGWNARTGKKIWARKGALLGTASNIAAHRRAEQGGGRWEHEAERHRDDAEKGDEGAPAMEQRRTAREIHELGTRRNSAGSAAARRKQSRRGASRARRVHRMARAGRRPSRESRRARGTQRGTTKEARLRGMAREERWRGDVLGAAAMEESRGMGAPSWESARELRGPSTMGRGGVRGGARRWCVRRELGAGWLGLGLGREGRSRDGQ